MKVSITLLFQFLVKSFTFSGLCSVKMYLVLSGYIKLINIMFFCTKPICCTDPSTYFAFQAKLLNILQIFSYQDRFASVTGMSEIPDEMAWVTETSSSHNHINLQTKWYDLQLRTYSYATASYNPEKYLTLITLLIDFNDFSWCISSVCGVL